MLKKWKGYVLNVQGIIYWKGTIDENGNVVFVKTKLNEPFELYIEILKVRDGFYKALDAVTGREFAIVENNGLFMLLPSLIGFNKTAISQNVNVLDKSADIVGDEERENYYTSISEDILSHTYFCEKISNEKGISVVPSYMIDAYKASNLANNLTRKKK